MKATLLEDIEAACKWLEPSGRFSFDAQWFNDGIQVLITCDNGEFGAVSIWGVHEAPKRWNTWAHILDTVADECKAIGVGA